MVMTPRISRAQAAKNKGFTQCPPGYAHGYSDMGTYAPVPFVGDFWGDDFMPFIGWTARYYTDAAMAESIKRWRIANKDKVNAGQRRRYNERKNRVLS